MHRHAEDFFPHPKGSQQRLNKGKGTPTVRSHLTRSQTHTCSHHHRSMPALHLSQWQRALQYASGGQGAGGKGPHSVKLCRHGRDGRGPPEPPTPAKNCRQSHASTGAATGMPVGERPRLHRHDARKHRLQEQGKQVPRLFDPFRSM